MNVRRRTAVASLMTASVLSVGLATATVALVYVGLARVVAGSWTGPTLTQPVDRLEVVRTALAAAAGVGAIVALVITYRRQRLQELDTGEAVRQLGEAAAQLGAEHDVTRLAGAYAIAAIADREPRLREQCAKILCAAMRLPPAAISQGDDEVRRSIGEIVCKRLSADHSAPWTFPISLVNARLVDFTLTDTHVLSELDLTLAYVVGPTRLDGTRFRSAVTLRGAQFEDECSARSAIFEADFDGEGAQFRADANFDRCQMRTYMSLRGATVDGTLWLRHATCAEFAASDLHVRDSMLMDSLDVGGNVDLRNVHCEILFAMTAVTMGGNMWFGGLTVAGEWDVEGVSSKKRADLDGVSPRALAHALGDVLGPGPRSATAD